MKSEQTLPNLNLARMITEKFFDDANPRLGQDAFYMFSVSKFILLKESIIKKDSVNSILYFNNRKFKKYIPIIQEFYKPISLERGAELRKIMIQKLKQLKVPEKDMKDIVNQYYKEYKDFCFNFPEHEKLREDNFFVYYQCIDLLNYMENLKPETALEEGGPFKQFMLDKNKEKLKSILS